MKGDAKRLIKYLEGADKRFIIPVYQRNYDWKIENCKRLFDDIEKVIQNNRKNHFFGSIVATMDEGLDEHLIIDGQQRLTTITLLFLAMYHLIDEGVFEPEDPKLKKKIYKKYLIDEYESGTDMIKLKPVKDDQRALNILFESPEDRIPGTSMTINYEYLRGRLMKTPYSMDDIYDSISRFIIIDISLNESDDPQLIFESLNSTGLDLSEGDKIRNYVLMGLRKDKQEAYYNKYWNKIEKNTDFNVDLFVRDYLSLKRRRTPTMNKIYLSFKEYLEELHYEDVEIILKELLSYSRRYKILVEGTGKHDRLDFCIYRLNKLETTVIRPYCLEVLRLGDEKIISEKDILEIFETIESYIFRRIICDIPTNALNKIFIALHNEIEHYDGTYDDYVSKMKYALISKKESGKFPDNPEFKNSFENKNIYNMQAKNKKYYFERMENFGTLETKAVWEHIDAGEYTIEHIMPQTLSEQWKKDLSVYGNPLDIQEEWLHKAANLTLSAYNSNYQNSPFSEKRDIKNGFSDSGLRVNQWLSKQDAWGVPQLKERNSLILEKAMEIWEYPSTDYRPEIKPEDFTSLADETDMKGKRISKVSFKGMEKTVNTWVDMYQNVLIMLHSQNEAVLKKLAYSNIEEPPATSFVTSEDGFNKCRKIDEDIFVWIGNNTESKLSVLRMLFPMYGEDENELIFYLRSDDKENEDEAKRYSLRRKFWSYVLPELKTAFADTSVYQNTQATKDNWIYGAIGISGLSLNSVIRYDSARVEYYINFDETQETKDLFDYLYSKKDVIEKTFGDALIWDRGTDKHSSKIAYQLDEISLADEEEWDAIKIFMATKGRKLYDVLKPLCDFYFV